MRVSRVGTNFVTVTRCVGVAICGMALASCMATVDSKYGVKSSQRVVANGQPVPKGGGTYRVGDPYMVGGKTYVPREDTRYRAEGQASWYGSDFHGRRTANGEVFDMYSISAAHPTLPLPSYVRITNLENHRSIVVRVNDRGPYHDNRVIDVSVRAAKLLGFYDKGVARVRVEYVGKASLNGSDDTKLAETLRSNEPITPVARAASAPAPTPALLHTAMSAPPSLITAYAPVTQIPVLTGRGLY